METKAINNSCLKLKKMVENTMTDIKEHYRKLDEQMQEVHKIRKDGWNRIKGLIKKKIKD
jgi:hypothetical protein